MLICPPPAFLHRLKNELSVQHVSDEHSVRRAWFLFNVGDQRLHDMVNCALEKQWHSWVLQLGTKTGSSSVDRALNVQLQLLLCQRA